MAIPKKLKEAVADNDRSLAILARSLTLAQGDFVVILVHCNSVTLGPQIMNRLREISAIKPRELFLPKSAQTLYTTIATELGQAQPPAVIVYGLPSVIDLDRVLISANIARNEFRKKFHFPLVLWVTDEVLRKMIRIAPDFYSWSTVAIRFVATHEELSEFPGSVKQL